MSQYGDPLPTSVGCPTCGATGHPDTKPCQGLPAGTYHRSRERAAQDLLQRMLEVEGRDRTSLEQRILQQGNRILRGRHR